MIAEHRTVEEKVGTEIADGYCGNAILALGLVGIEEQAADCVFRLKYSNDPHSYGDALKAVSKIAKSLDARHNWRLNSHALLAAAVLEYWLCDLCPSCTGIGATPIPGAPVLGPACPSCHGSGKRDYPWRQTGRSAQYHTLTLIALEEAERRVRGKLIDRLAYQIRDSWVLTTT
jgi:hypothetical protein